jgi:hypothetical protein
MFVIKMENAIGTQIRGHVLVIGIEIVKPEAHPFLGCDAETLKICERSVREQGPSIGHDVTEIQINSTFHATILAGLLAIW